MRTDKTTSPVLSSLRSQSEILRTVRITVCVPRTPLNNIGAVYRDRGLYDQALENHQQALVIARRIGDRAGEARTLNNIGIVYHDRGLYDQALENYQQARVVARDVGLRTLEEVVLSNINRLSDY